jgi:quinol monooxygenase YgiN
MSFDEEQVPRFLDIFNESREIISQMPGCLYLELWRDHDQENVFVTHSHWQSAEALEAYRASTFFKDVWKSTKVLFNEKPLAFSVVRVDLSN